MKITIFKETDSKDENFESEMLSEGFGYSEKYEKIAKELSIILKQEIMYINGNLDEFPNEGLVLFVPFLGQCSWSFLELQQNVSRIILMDVLDSVLKEYDGKSEVLGMIFMGSVTGYLNSGTKFWMAGKKEVVGDKTLDLDYVRKGFTEINYDLFHGLIDALGWYIKELDKSGLVKDHI